MDMSQRAAGVCVFVCGCSFEYSVLNLSRSRMLFEKQKNKEKKKIVAARRRKTIGAFVLTLLSSVY